MSDADSQAMQSLIRRWRAHAEDYRRQVEEARPKNLTHDQTLAMMTALRSCANDLEAALLATRKASHE